MERFDYTLLLSIPRAKTPDHRSIVILSAAKDLSLLSIPKTKPAPSLDCHPERSEGSVVAQYTQDKTQDHRSIVILSAAKDLSLLSIPRAKPAS